MEIVGIVRSAGKQCFAEDSPGELPVQCGAKDAEIEIDDKPSLRPS